MGLFSSVLVLGLFASVFVAVQSFIFLNRSGIEKYGEVIKYSIQNMMIMGVALYITTIHDMSPKSTFDLIVLGILSLTWFAVLALNTARLVITQKAAFEEYQYGLR